ncbi:type II toxin-antitoxin system prevent-host-death family antitoxin [Frankia sp. AgB1.9]|uniref:type II toxin-antitoxin system Phd/YefM family antitoxin n=1 Tax=unclassified Frankia TaxID=2632575 RepID=UPI001933C573|nr:MULTISPECIES: type II toxin-antitoxin system prevent-host-death family antitoxin [unclassified Frankia]MBL7493105.1 type II toxin-antitoxin system prevent-host-death family antitoxin [Frankia sp. AgW1.1]MBL7552367.1 type II toxin-antitoxin system prevent-host-death family antitoxin [Frankia sp. AgB1.9]MBL7622134.1 type II toxin-antitoxin system prevent-host-death family antitoxin [Frankia sp. AgB1.8]
MSVVTEHVPRRITQRELRDDAGDILRAVESGETFVVTRDGDPIAELTPARRSKFVPMDEILATFANEPTMDADQFFADLDEFDGRGLISE